jgi:hypothetical protein
MPETPITTRAVQRKTPASDETPVNDAEGAVLGALSDGNAHVLLPGNKDSADADADVQAACDGVDGSVEGAGCGLGGSGESLAAGA